MLERLVPQAPKSVCHLGQGLLSINLPKKARQNFHATLEALFFSLRTFSVRTRRKPQQFYMSLHANHDRLDKPLHERLASTPPRYSVCGPPFVLQIFVTVAPCVEPFAHHKRPHRTRAWSHCDANALCGIERDCLRRDRNYLIPSEIWTKFVRPKRTKHGQNVNLSTNTGHCIQTMTGPPKKAT